MFYKGQRHGVPATMYGIVGDLLLETGWTWEEFCDQPADLIDELCIKLSKRPG